MEEKHKTEDLTLKLKLFTAPLSFTDAANYIFNFPGDLRDVFFEHLGGTISAEAIRDMIKNRDDGLMAWFCLDNSSAVSSKIYLAFEAVSKFVMPESREQAEALRPAPGNLFFSGNRFSSSFEDNPASIKAFLMGHECSPIGPDRFISDVKVWEYCQSYLRVSSIKGYQEYGMSYFENDSGQISDLIKPATVRYVRYYFGFHHGGFPNRIRVMLTAVDENGKNISINSRGDETFLLQKSFPPPPYE